MPSTAASSFTIKTPTEATQTLTSRGGTFLSKLRHWQNVAQTPITHKPILLGKQAQTVMASKPPRLFFKALSNRLIQS